MKDYKDYIEHDIYAKVLLSKLIRINYELKIQARNMFDTGFNYSDIIDLTVVKNALSIAKKYHGDQKRKSGEPYFSHPVAVASLTADYLPKTDAIVGAILHDTVEDTNLTYEVIEENFGSRVKEIVFRLTRIRNEKLSIEQMLENSLLEFDDEALIIKLLDRVHNIQTIDFMSDKKQKEIVIETIKDIIMLVFAKGMYREYEELVKICNRILNINLSHEEEENYDNYQHLSLIV